MALAAPPWAVSATSHELILRSQKQAFISRNRALVHYCSLEVSHLRPETLLAFGSSQNPLEVIPQVLWSLYCAIYEGGFPWGAEHQIHRLVHWTLSLPFDGIVFCSFLSTSHSLLHFPISTAGPLSAHFIRIIHILHLSSQSLMKMLNNSKPNTHPSGPTGHFPLISCITFHPSYVLWLQVSCWFGIHVTFFLSSPVWTNFMSANLRDALTKCWFRSRPTESFTIFRFSSLNRLIECSLFLINCAFLMHLFLIVFHPWWYLLH